MAELHRYAVADDPDEWGDAYVYDSYIEAKDEARRRGACVVELHYEYTDSELADDFRPDRDEDDEEEAI